MKKRELLNEICEKFHIALLYLFGSQADKGLALLQGKEVKIEDPLSDLDIGVVFIYGLPDAEEIIDLYADLYNELTEVFLPFKADLTLLEENHSVFQASAITGICLYSQSEKFRTDYEENIFRRAVNFKPFLDMYLDEYLEEVLEDG